MNKWKSRKWWSALIAIACSIFLMWTGYLDAATGGKIILGAAAAFIGGEALVDALSFFKKSS